MKEERKQDTFAVKIDTDIKEELRMLIESYKAGAEGSNAGDFIKVLVDTYKLNKLTKGIDSTSADVKELNVLTSRIYSIYSNLVQRIETNSVALQQQFNESLEIKDNNMNEFKDKLEKTKNEYENLQKEFTQIMQEKKELEKESIQLKEANENYKEINNTFREKLQERDKYKIKNEELLHQIEELESNNKNILDITIQQNDELKYLKNERERTNKENSQIVETIKGTMEFQKEKELLQKDIEFNKQLKELQEQNNRDVRIMIEREQKLMQENKDLYKEIELLKEAIQKKENSL